MRRGRFCLKSWSLQTVSSSKKQNAVQLSASEYVNGIETVL